MFTLFHFVPNYYGIVVQMTSRRSKYALVLLVTGLILASCTEAAMLHSRPRRAMFRRTGVIFRRPVSLAVAWRCCNSGNILDFDIFFNKNVDLQ